MKNHIKNEYPFYIPEGFWRPAFHTEPLILTLIERQKSGWAVCKKDILNYIAAHELFLYLKKHNMIGNKKILELVQNIPVLLSEQFCRQWELQHHWKNVLNDDYIHNEYINTYETYLQQVDIANIYSLSSPTHFYIWNEYLKTKEGLDSFAEAINHSMELWTNFLEAPFLKSNNFEELETISNHLFSSNDLAETFIKVESTLFKNHNNPIIPLIDLFFEKINLPYEEGSKILAQALKWNHYHLLFNFDSELVHIGAYNEINSDFKDSSSILSYEDYNKKTFSKEWIYARNNQTYLNFSNSKFKKLNNPLVHELFLKKNENLNKELSLDEQRQFYLYGDYDNACFLAQAISLQLNMDIYEIHTSSNISFELFQCKNKGAFCFLNIDKLDVDLNTKHFNNAIFWFSSTEKEPPTSNFLAINCSELPSSLTQQALEAYLQLKNEEDIIFELKNIKSIENIKKIHNELSSKAPISIKKAKEHLRKKLSKNTFNIKPFNNINPSLFKISSNKISNLYLDIQAKIQSNLLINTEFEKDELSNHFLFTGMDFELKNLFIQSLSDKFEYDIFEINASEIKKEIDLVYLTTLISLEKSKIINIKNIEKSKFIKQIYTSIISKNKNSLIFIETKNSLENSIQNSSIQICNFDIHETEALKNNVRHLLKPYWNPEWSSKQEDSIFSLLFSNSGGMDKGYQNLETKLKQYKKLHPGLIAYDTMITIVVQLLHGFISDSNQKLNQKELHHTAIHECGHALLALRGGMEVPFLTGVAMSNMDYAAGYAEFNNKNCSKDFRNFFIDEVIAFYGGIAAEQVVFGDYGNGGSMDIKIASGFIDSFIKEFGWGYQGPYFSTTLKDNHKYQEEPIFWAKHLFEAAVKWLTANKELLISMGKELTEKQFMLKDDLEKYRILVGKIKYEPVSIPTWTPGALESYHVNHIKNKIEEEKTNIPKEGTLHKVENNSSEEQSPPETKEP